MQFTTDIAGNKVHSTAIVGPMVSLGENNYIGPYCIIDGPATIGNNNRFESHVCIGSTPEHKQAWKEKRNLGVIIGSSNVFREFVTVNGGYKSVTEIYNDCCFLRGSHVGHDTLIHNNCIISCNVMIGGHSTLFESVNMGLASVCHQMSFIGQGAMIGMGTVIPKLKRILPYKTYVGSPCRELKDNEYLIKNQNLTHLEIIELRKTYNTAFNTIFLIDK